MLHDYSTDFSRIRGQLHNTAGVKYTDFAQSLSPILSVVARDIAIGYLALVLGLLGVDALLAFTDMLVISLVLVFAGAAWVGFWIANIQLFIHEAAHFNIARTRAKNDFFANFFLGIMVGTSIADYRKVHFKHHGKLGTTQDSEHSYFFPMNIGFLVKMLTGIRVMEIIISRRRLTLDKSLKDNRNISFIFLGLSFHLFVIATLYVVSGLALALVWCVGVGVFFPLFGAIRQVLEHRSEGADAALNYFEVDHGAITRNFGTDVFSRTFGGAGFNRHLLHHWEPNISYTRFNDLVAFMEQTEIADILTQRQSSYGRTFIQLLQANKTTNPVDKVI